MEITDEVREFSMVKVIHVL